VTSFLAELGTRLADRWLTLLVLPGALLVAAAATADTLGQAHAIDLALLRVKISALAVAPGAHSPGVLLIAAGGLLAASALAGLIAAALGSAVSGLWTASPPAGNPDANRLVSWLCRPAGWLAARRSRSWHARDDRWRTVLATAEPLRRRAALMDAGIAAVDAQISADSRTATRLADAALARRNRIARAEPARLTWIGDRFHDAETRMVNAYDLDVTLAWPRLWAVLPASLRADLSAAHDAYTATARLIGWALLYLVVGVWWWPSLIIAAVAGVTGWVHGRTGAAVLADLAETAVDLHGRTLAAQLGITCDGPLNRDAGFLITSYLRSGGTG
jgi:hypothetical protein